MSRTSGSYSLILCWAQRRIVRYHGSIAPSADAAAPDDVRGTTAADISRKSRRGIAMLLLCPKPSQAHLTALNLHTRAYLAVVRSMNKTFLLKCQSKLY